ncbi:NAD-dependent epimerase/dehydratase family protein [Streptosporangium fragile]|uniref:NAD-dependent epimerase/dehydratase family protein n=1 Tax=Streptosporangium fragile TaxID=46186 RepID=A0ABN3VR72_9ACTN
MAHYLVTGGAGFIGSYLVESLMLRGHRVVVLDDLSGGTRERAGEAELVVGSVCDVALVDELFERCRFDGVFHLAAFAAEGISHVVKRFNYETNVLGTVNLVNAALNCGAGFFLFVSSVAVYGAGRTPMRESDIPAPADSYGIAKLTCERELEVTQRMQGLKSLSVRLHNVYGEWQSMRDPYRNAVAIFLNQILRDEPITVYGDGGQVRAFTYVQDIVDRLVAAPGIPEVWGRALNLGARRTYTVAELADAVRVAMGVPEHPIVNLPVRDEVRVAFTDSSLARELMGDWEDTPLEVGLGRTAAWAREHGAQKLHSVLRHEVDERLLPEWARHVENRLASS